MSQPRTLGEYERWLYENEQYATPAARQAFKLDRRVLHRILYGSDTEPGLVERVDHQLGFTPDGLIEKRAVRQQLQAEIATPEPTKGEG